jgi:hypothetical protein
MRDARDLHFLRGNLEKQHRGGAARRQHSKRNFFKEILLGKIKKVLAALVLA